jgi:hypothetical protein
LAWRGSGGSDGGSDGEIFTAVPEAVSITGVSPASGPSTGGNTVTITGTGFGGMSDPSDVTFDGFDALSYNVVNQHEVTAVAPPHALGTVTVQVTAANGASNETDNYTYVLPNPTRFQETDSRFYFSSGWSTSTYSAYSGGAEKYSHQFGATVWVPFRGARFDYIAKTANNLGIASVSVDGGPAVAVDLYSRTTAYKVKVWSTDWLTDGLHVVKIVCSGKKNLKSSGTSLTIDAVDVVGTLASPTVYQENDPAIMTTGTWNTVWASSLSGGKLKATLTRGSKMIVRFDGVRLNLHATKGRTYGKAWVSLDGRPAILVDLYSYATKHQQTVYSTGFLTPGPHTLIISYSGYKNPYATGTTIDVDAFKITGDLGGIF